MKLTQSSIALRKNVLRAAARINNNNNNNNNYNNNNNNKIIIIIIKDKENDHYHAWMHYTVSQRGFKTF